ncbi:AEC family transporter [Uliginosibacterium paludis]|uniref:AEC family transporter n=1 Tax=Uliginosibacterium paludis TaxID=1615952 RepID=A0ABV2CM98_9RHOO
MSLFIDRLAASSPLFILIFAGFAIARWARWPAGVSEGLTRVVFNLALPAMLFFTLSDFSRLPAVDARLLIAFFGGIFVVFLLARVAGRLLFRLDGVSGSIFALGTIFSNNAMLGLPLARATLGEGAIPSVALVLAFNSLTLWTLVMVSIEWAQHGELSARGFAKTARGVLTNPLILAIMAGALFGLTGLPLPHLVSEPVSMLAQAATPLSLLVLGMGLAEFRIREGLVQSLTVCFLKLLVLPLVVWGIALLLHLPPMETRVVVLLSSMAMGVNVYLMSRQFRAFEGPTAAAMVLSTVFSAAVTPLVLTLIS